MLNLFDLREDFLQKSLSKKDVLTDPIAQFEMWLNQALEAGVREPNAMNLATVGKDMRPSSRVVLLKQVRKEGFVFFTNYESKKAIQLDDNPNCALNFTWLDIERQVRVEGVAEKISNSESDAYFEVRPLNSRLGAWASPQSRVIPNRKFLEKVTADMNRKFEGKAVTRPENWGGYIVRPSLIEFWQGRESRLHDRIQYICIDGKWMLNRLAP